MAKKAVLTEYTIKSKNPNNLRIALVSDLHERKADDILELLRGSKPDIIAIAGDTLERYSCDEPEEPVKINVIKEAVFVCAYCINRVFRFFFGNKNPAVTENSYRFLREATRLAPVYMSLGNHEERLSDEDFKFLSENNICLLDNEDTEFVFNNQRILIGGLSSDYDEEWLDRFSQKQGYKILLCHHPEYFDPIIKPTDINLTLSGHTHGGQIRIFGKGVLASSVGFFPKYDRGVFDNRLVVSAGCSNTVAIPRINNPRELVVITIKADA